MRKICENTLAPKSFERIAQHSAETIHYPFYTSSYNVQNGLKGVFGVFAFHLYEIVFAVCSF